MISNLHTDISGENITEPMGDRSVIACYDCSQCLPVSKTMPALAYVGLTLLTSNRKPNISAVYSCSKDTITVTFWTLTGKILSCVQRILGFHKYMFHVRSPKDKPLRI